MSNVLILGAGSSRNHGITGGTAPPSAKEFFSFEFKNRISQLYKPLFRYLEDYFNIASDQSIEMVFSRIQNKWDRDAYGDRSQLTKEFGPAFLYCSAPDMLRSYIIDLILIGTAWLEQHTCPRHDYLASKLVKPGDKIISFNYDLIIESSLKKAGLWHESSGYGFYPAGNSRWLKNKQQSQVTLLKPHGSINWFKSKRKETNYNPIFPGIPDASNKTISKEIKYVDAIEVLPVIFRMQGKVPTELTNENEFLELLHLIPQHISATENLIRLSKPKPIQYAITFGNNFERSKGFIKDYFPVMVFPTPYKDYKDLTFGELYDVWSNVDSTFYDSDEVFSCGFSFSDEHFNQAMIEAGAARKKPIKLNMFFGGNDMEFNDIRGRLISKHIKLFRYKGWLENYINDPNPVFTDVNQ